MGWTYTTPPASAKDQVRFWSGDIDETMPYTQSDEDIAYLLGLDFTAGDVYATAALVARRIGDRYAELGAGKLKQVGPLHIQTDSATKAAVWYARADRLAAGAPDGSLALAGGLFTGDGDPVFKVGLQDNGSIDWRPELGRG